MPQLNFQYPEFLWLLAGVPLLLLAYGWHAWRRSRAVRRMGDPRLVKELLAGAAPGRQLLKFSLALIAFALGVLALANPRHPDKGSVDVRKGIDIMMALDVSNSMLAKEGSTSRLQAARSLMQQLISALPNDRVGLVLFAGNAYVQMPLTFDRGAAELFVATASPAAVKAQGTAIGEALQQAALSFDTESERFQTILLLTDGETHDEGALDKAKELAELGVMINTVGIGSPEGAPLEDTITGQDRVDEAGNTIISKLNEPLLQELATSSKGQYLRLSGNTREVATTLASSFRQMEQKGLGDASQFNYLTLYLWFAVPMAILLLLEIFIPTRKRVKT